MRRITSVDFRNFLVVSALLGAGAALNAQPAKLPTADDAKALQAKFQAERDKVVKDGSAKRFLPILMEKADELAKKSETALAAGRLAQAAEAIRQARWQLPYQPVGVPDHVSRIIGNLRLRHSREIKALAFSPDGQRLATASSDGTVKIWDLGNGHELRTYTGHTDKLRAIAWSNDGKYIASAGEEQTIKIWNPATGKDEHSILGAGKATSSLAFSKDGKHLFTGQFEVPDNTKNGLFVYETKTGKLVREVRDFALKIDAIAVSHEGNIVAVGDDQGNVRLFQYPSFIDNINQPAYWSQQNLNGATYHLSFSPDDKTLVRTDPVGVKLYNTPLPGAPFQIAAPRLTINTIGNQCAVLSKDGKTLFVGNTDGNILLYDPDNDGQKIGEYKNAHTGAINALAFNPDGSQLASCSRDYTVRLWDFNVVLQSRDFEGHNAPVWTAAFSPDATKIISASADRTVKVWDRDTAKVLFTITDHTAPVTVAKFSPDGKLIASAGGDKIVRIFDAANGKPLRTCEGHTGTITSLDFSADSKKIVSGGSDRRVKIWDADTGKPILSIDDNPSIPASVAFHPNGKQIAVGNIDQTIRLYDAGTGKMQNDWNAHGTAVNSVAYSPNGLWLASCGADMAVQIWPLATPGTNSIRLVGHTGPVSMVAFRMDNIHVISCGADQLIKLWKIEGNGGKEVQTFRGHKDWVTSVAFSKDGFHVVSSSVDKRVKIWEITSRELPLLAEHSMAVETVAVSPDGKIIATGSADRTIKLWDRQTGVEIATLTGHKNMVLALIFSPDSKRIISTDSGGAVLFWEVNPPRDIPRTEKQMNVFGRMSGSSPYLVIDSSGKTLFAWLPPEFGKPGTMVEAFDIDSGTPLFKFTEDESRFVPCIAFSANGKLAATGGRDGSVRLREMRAKSADLVPGGDWFLFDKIGVADLALSPDGSVLVAASAKGEMKIAKVKGREILKSFKGHDTGIAACVLSPDGKLLATVGIDNVVKAWTTEGQELRSWDLGRNLVIRNIAFSADGKQLVTANANTTVYVLDLP